MGVDRSPKKEKKKRKEENRIVEERWCLHEGGI